MSGPLPPARRIGARAVPARFIAAAAVAILIAGGCSDGRKAAATVPPSHRRARSVFVVIGGRETSGAGLHDSLHTSWPQVVFSRRFGVGAVHVNLARNDTTVADALVQQLPLAVEQRPTIATVWLGEGDDDVHTPPEQFGRDLRTLLGRLRRGGSTRVIVASPPADAPGGEYISQIAAAAQSSGAEVVPLSAAAWDPRAPRTRREAVQAAAAAELGRAVKQ